MDNNRITRRTTILTNHLRHDPPTAPTILHNYACLSYSPPELSESNPTTFDTFEMRKLLDGHNLEDRDWLFGLMIQSGLFNRREVDGRVFVNPDYNQSMEQQREMTMKRIAYLLDRGVFRGWLTGDGPQEELRKLALHEVIGMYDHSLAVKLGVHIFLWGGAVKFLGTKRHHDKWLRATENYDIKGCFAMSELGHGSNVRGIETVTTYDPNSGEFVINTPCESAQKYWIGGAANHATHTIVFSQLNINGSNQGVHAFIAQIRDSDGNICPNIRIAECGHKIGLNGVDNGRIWFDNVRIPRENLLNSVADVSPSGEYLSAIKNTDQRFAAFLAPAVHHSELAGKLLRGELPKDEYIYFMMILWRVYNAIEEGLETHSSNPVLAPIYRPALLSRAGRLSADIAYLLDTTEDAWQSTPLYRSLVSAPPQGLRGYVAHLEQLTVSKDSAENARLLAHAYVRYLGDLSGGQTIRNRMAKVYDLPDTGAGASFYDFGSLQGNIGTGEKKATQGDLLRIKEWYREGMNEAVGDDKALKEALVQEANLAFDFNRRIFQDVASAANDVELSDYTTQSKVVFDGSEGPEEKTYPVSSVVAFVMALALAHFILVVGGFTGSRGTDKLESFMLWLREAVGRS